jgi:GT2 family glycosyltransferase
MAEIAVIIVNYGTWELALNGVASVLERTHGGRSVEVHLVDNASPEGDAEKIAAAIVAREWQDRLTFYPETENHGFGRGNNVVLRALAAREDPPRYVFLLNPDAALDNETLAILAEFLDAHPQAGLAGAGIRMPDHDGLVTAAFRFPGILSIFEEAASLGPLTRLLRRYQVSLPADSGRFRAGWVSGAAFMARFKTLKSIDFFDPAFFLYYEEVDLMHRAAKAGWECWYMPEARVVHAEGAATGVRSAETRRKRRPGYWYASWRHYFMSNHGRAYTFAAGLAWMAGCALNIIFALLRGREHSVPQHLFGDLWRLGMKPLLLRG